MRFRLSTIVCMLALTGCVDHAARDRLGIVDPTVMKAGVGVSQDEAAGAANPQWVSTYAALRGNQNSVDSLQQRLDQLPGDKREYFPAKAQCWLNAARDARRSGDHWGFVEEAIGQSAVLTLGLENGAALSAINPALRTVSTVRPDLWQVVRAIKADAVVAQCLPAQAPLACAEVELMQAGHDAWRRSFAAAEKRVPQIQSLLRASADTALQCKQANEAAAAVPASLSASASGLLARSARRVEKITLRTDSLFHFDAGDHAAISPAGRRELDAVLRRLKAAPPSSELRITGYADRLGEKAHNQTLSLQRARAVERYLRAHGLPLATATQGRGSASPLVECRQKKPDALARCLAPNRRVEIELFVAAT